MITLTCCSFRLSLPTTNSDTSTMFTKTKAIFSSSVVGSLLLSRVAQTIILFNDSLKALTSTKSDTKMFL
nr:MAG TPA: hypothetical protein [Caudoviricetes sp.]